MQKIISHIPNILSALRLFIAILFPFAAERYWIWLIITGGASDFLDGWVARRFQVASWKGRVLDAFADKLFVFSVLMTFVSAGGVFLWMVPFIIARDLMVVSISAYTFYLRDWDAFRRMETRWSGKAATAGQFLLLVTVAVMPAYTYQAAACSIILSMAAAGDYGLQFAKALQQKKEGAAGH
jgi:phosphatidylglycerophosphate synthase